MVGGQADHRTARIVRNTHNMELPSAVRKKLLDRRTQAAARPDTAETARKIRHAANGNRRVQWAAQRPPDKSGGSLRSPIDRLIHRRYFSNPDLRVERTR
ncbi:MAG: hypothetical protein U5K38_06160 [Woeseiaceae bacterium]|nr:hypothetical protein [Woeseiaceae bacterium]